MAEIDSLVVTLTLDPRDFQKGERVVASSQRRMREDAQRTDKEFRSATKSINEALTRTRNIALGLFTVFTAGRGISSFVQQTTESSAALGRLSRDLGISTQQLSAWEAVSRRAGNAAGEISGAFAGINARIQNFRLTGDGSQLAGFNALRVAVSDTRGNVRPTQEILQDALDAIGRRAPQERLTFAQQIGGGQELVNLSAMSRAQRSQMLGESQGSAVTAAQAAQAERLREAYIRMENALTAVGQKLVEELTPGLVAVANAFRRFGEFLTSDQFEPVWRRLRDNMRSFEQYVGSDRFQDALKGLADGVVTLAEKIIQALRWLDLIPSDPQQGPMPDGSVIGSGGPARGSGPSGRDRFWGWVTGRTPEEQQQMRLQREQRGELAPGTPEHAARTRQLASDLQRDFGLTGTQAAGIVGNLDRESGLNAINERNPLIPGSRGGFGYAQWTGPRRRAFEAWAAERGLDINSYEANYGFLRHELNTHGAGAIANVRRTTTAEGATEAFYPFLSGGDPRAIAAMGDRLRRARRAEGVITAPPPDASLMQGPRQGAFNSYGGNTTTSSVQIGQVTVQTQATDAAGIARDLAPAIRRHTFVDQATVGLS